jgi:hypothetical protein
MKQKCPKGYRYCSVQRKCVPAGQERGMGRREERGRGKGPMGKPRKEQDEEYPGGTTAMPSLPYDHPKKRQIVKEPPMEVGRNLKMKKIKNEINLVFSEQYEEKADLNKIFESVDNILNEMGKGCPSTNDIPNGRRPYDDPDEQMMALRKDIAEALKSFNEGEEYQEFFKKMLKKYGVTSPDQLSDDEKKDFFNKVDKGWKAEKETD